MTRYPLWPRSFEPTRDVRRDDLDRHYVENIAKAWEAVGVPRSRLGLEIADVGARDASNRAVYGIRSRLRGGLVP